MISYFLDFDSDGSSPGSSYETQFLSSIVFPSPNDKRERRFSLKRDGSKDEKAGKKALLQKFMETQMHSVVTSLHHEVLKYWGVWKDMQAKRRPAEEQLVNSLRTCVSRIWPFARLEEFGSWAAGLPGSGSDIDLVVCFSDECQSLPMITGVLPLLQGLANFLEKDACDYISIKKVG
jgi:DNA polymerase sigma